VTRQQVQFGPLSIAYDDEVLEPRPWTVEQSRRAIQLLADLPDGPVLELCAGAGQIGLVVAVESGRSLVQVDTDEGACGYARRNAAHAGVDADVRCQDLREAVLASERFPLVLADPPYIPADEVDDLPEDPDEAIDGGDDGLDVARTCLAVAAAHLAEGGRVVLQLGTPEQAEDLRGDAVAVGLEVLDVQVVGDEGVLVVLGPTG